MTATYDLIASNVLTSSAASVTFSSLPSSYRDLILVCTAKTASANALIMRLNGSTSAIYPWVNMFGNGSTATSATETADTFFNITASAGTSSTEDSLVIIHIMDYSATDKHKTILRRFNRAGAATEASAGRFASTSAINEVKVEGFSANISAGSSFYLYGIVS